MADNIIEEIQNDDAESQMTEQVIILNIPTDSEMGIPMESGINEVDQLLCQWNLYYLSDKFAEAGYDQLSDLAALSEIELKLMFPLYSEQCHKIRLRRKIIEWRKENGLTVEVELLSESTKSGISSVRSWLEKQTDHSNRSTPTLNTSAVPPLGNDLAHFNLQKFLETDKGRKILKCYSSLNPPRLDNINRKILIDSILEYHYTSNVKLTYNDFDKISDDIANTFAGEKKDWYYHRVEKERPTGKLYNRYRNEAPKLRKTGYFESPKRFKADLSKHKVCDNHRSDVITTIRDYSKEDEYEKDKEWLQSMDAPWSTVEIKFQNTFGGRRLELSKESFNVATFYEEWIIYRNPDAFRLIDLEFEMLYPGKEYCIKKKWDAFVKKILPIMITNIKDKTFIEQLNRSNQNDDSFWLLLFKGLHYLLKPSARLIRKTDKKIWKISIRDSINAFVLELNNNVSNLTEEITKKREIYNQFEINLQPLIVILDTAEDTQYGICYDQIYYSFKNILECISVAFKLHFALNLNYSIECYNVWLFIQHFFFNITTSCDKQVVKVASLISELDT